jgi:hypothetical protein
VTDSLLAGLRERIARYRATGDRHVVLSLDVELELGALLGPNEGFDVESAYVGGLMYWLRYRAGCGSATELAEALRLLALVQDNQTNMDEHPIPGPVRLILDGRHAR